MRLVGAMKTNGDAWDLAAFGRLFEQMKQVENTGHPMRYVGFEGGCGDVRFFGVEVESVDRIPEGMVGWAIEEDCLVVTAPGSEPLTLESSWLWFDRSDSGRACGEFAASCPSDWVSSADSRLEFHMTTNAYFARDAGPDDEVVLVSYDPAWPGRYQEFAQWVRCVLGPDVALRIEHYGSTAIPNMPAKPVIDMLIEVPSFREARKRAIPAFDSLECEYWWYSDHMVFIFRNGFLGPRTHHLHLAPAGHRIWEGIAFRDHLISHPDDAARYAALKHELADRHRADRETYTQAKAAFVNEIAAKIRGCRSADSGL